MMILDDNCWLLRKDQFRKQNRIAVETGMTENLLCYLNVSLHSNQQLSSEKRFIFNNFCPRWIKNMKMDIHYGLIQELSGVNWFKILFPSLSSSSERKARVLTREVWKNCDVLFVWMILSGICLGNFPKNNQSLTGGGWTELLQSMMTSLKLEQFERFLRREKTWEDELMRGLETVIMAVNWSRYWVELWLILL